MISQFDLVYFVRTIFIDRVNTIDSGRIFIVLAKVDAWEDDKSYDSESAFWCISPEHLNTLETTTFPFLMDKRDSVLQQRKSSVWVTTYQISSGMTGLKTNPKNLTGANRLGLGNT